MSICKRCGKSFDRDDACEVFEIEMGKEYARLTETLCADCAIEAIENKESGIYIEQCERCGKSFDPFEVEAEFHHLYSDDAGASIDECLCLDCAIDAYNDIPIIG